MGLRRAAHVAWRRVGDETVLIHLRDKKIFVLNSSGGFFWHRLDGVRDAADFLDGLSTLEPLPANASSGLETFLRRLLESDLVERAGPVEVADATHADEVSDGVGRGNDDAVYPFPSFVPPELIWQEELRNFGQSCAFISGASPACDSIPTT